jgi:hypothetical protein
MFGGNIVYAFHGDGTRKKAFEPCPQKSGFNICTDLLLPKKEGKVRRIARVETPKDYLVSDLVKGCNEYRPGKKAKEWWVKSIYDLNSKEIRIKKLNKKQKLAMDSNTYSFDLVVEKIEAKYTPDQNPYINRGNWFSVLFS